jgi:hypothetical protein
MTKRTVRAPKAALPETRRELDDPVVAIGQKIAEVIAALDRNDQEKPRADTADRDRSALNDYLEALESMALSQPATSLAGCMIQVALMNQMFNERDDNPSLSEYSNKQEARRFEIAVYSVIGVLFRETGRDPKTLGCDYYAGVQEGVTDRLGPFTGPIRVSNA